MLRNQGGQLGFSLEQLNRWWWVKADTVEGVVLEERGHVECEMTTESK